MYTWMKIAYDNDIECITHMSLQLFPKEKSYSMTHTMN